MISVATADDHKLLRAMLVKLVNGFRDFQIIYDAEDGNSLIERLQVSGPPDLLLLDVEMKGMNGYETAVWFRKNRPETRILVLSIFKDDDLIARMLATGVKGFISKNCVPEELEAAMRHVMQDGKYYLGNETSRFVEFALNGLIEGRKLLTDMEIMIVKLICTGASQKEIAGQLHVSLRRMQYKIGVVYEKLDVKNATELVIRAINGGLTNL